MQSASTVNLNKPTHATAYLERAFSQCESHLTPTSEYHVEPAKHVTSYGSPPGYPVEPRSSRLHMHPMMPPHRA